jgi:outer membrane receptor protein involved in Fe transport
MFGLMSRCRVKAALGLAASSIALAAAAASPAYAQEQTRQFDIPAQALSSALMEYSRQSDIVVVVPIETVQGKQAPAVQGSLTPSAALDRLLTGSGLEPRRRAEGGLTLVVAGANSPTRLGAADGAASSEEEIIVTAQKREERLMDVPIPVTAVNPDTLSANNLSRLQDYYSRVPGLSFTNDVQGAPILSIRGLATGAGLINPTVAIVVDDVQYGPSTSLGGGSAAPDIDPSELERIEVLRGPQGTLYGANSIGGLIKYVTARPSFDGIHGRVQVSSNSVEGSDSLGFSARGSFNAPMTTDLAVLGTLFYREDAGYIDNPVLDRSDVNSSNAVGGRLSSLWSPSSAFSLRLNAQYQTLHADGTNRLDNRSDDLEQTDLIGTGEADRSYTNVSAITESQLGDISLTTITAFGRAEVNDVVDYNQLPGLGFLRFFTNAYFGIPNNTTGTAVLDDSSSDKFTQEVRANIPLSSNVDWLVGGFYTREHNTYLQSVVSNRLSDGLEVARWMDFDWTVNYQEYAAFTDLTIRFTDRFDLQLGGRATRIVQDYRETDTGPFYDILGLPTTLDVPRVETNDDAFTYLVTPTYHISPDVMAYARFASGYRPGGPNATASPFGLPESFGPDRTQNYEIGLKGSFFDRRLMIDLSLYHIDWSDIQVSFLDPVTEFVYNANASEAQSEGFEGSVEARPWGGFTLTGWVALGNAELTEPFPAGSLVGAEGERLPYSPEVSGGLSLDQEFPLSENFDGVIGVNLNYVGERVGNFLTAAGARQTYPEYTRIDLHAGLQSEAWQLNAFANNVTDERTPLSGGVGSQASYNFTSLQPRTVGLSLTRSF